ncbi:MAG: PQQ-binding-like beta-propeller repeat protein [Bacteroidetes bacterium]|nr:PQQ-binding-like beta-propeller repeat protein [Bacteroidota bacterium]
MAAPNKLADWRLLLLVVFILSGCETLQLGKPLVIAPADNTTDGGSTSRANTSSEGPSPPLVLRWDHTTEGGFGPASPLIAGGYVIVSTKAGRVDVIELSNGRKVGRVTLGDAIEGAPVLVDERILVVPVAAGRDGLVAYNLATGSKAWTLRDNPHAAGLLLSGGTVVAAALDGTLRGIEPLTGNERWSMQPDSMRAFYAAPTEIADGLVVAADEAGGLVAFSPTTGLIRWRKEIGLPVMRTPSAFGGRFFVPTARGQLLAIDSAIGETVWIYRADTELARFATPAVDERYVMVGATDGVLRCLDPETGEEIWRHEFDGNISAAPLLTDHVVYVGTMGERIAALDASSGELLWDAELPGRVKSAPAARDGILIVLSEPKHVHAFDTQHIAASAAEN